MIGDWRVSHYPRCTHHVFLSHCAENRRTLVHPVYTGLQKDQYVPWLDRHHYPRGQGAFAALREAIIRCRHVVYFITEEFLSQGRGWNSVETAYSELLQANLTQPAVVLCNVQLPLFFLSRSHGILERSAWGAFVQSGRFYPPGNVDGGAANWAIQEITAFIRQEENRGQSLAIQIEKDPSFQRILADEKNLLSRVMCAYPLPDETAQVTN